jgi:phosphatidylethanolamine-binding protein (PEBP) family uncharacterized protein
MKITTFSCLTAPLLAVAIAACGGGGSASATAPTTPSGNIFALTSSVAVEGGVLPADYTCDGTSSSPPLAWTNAPANTKEFALLMTTIPVTGPVKYNWVLSGIPANTTALARNTTGVGTGGVGSDGPTTGYQSPCSQGPGLKTYTFTLYALSASPALLVAANAVNGVALSTAISSITLGSSTLNLTYSRGTGATTPTTSPTGTVSANCTLVSDSLKASTTGVATSTCDSTYAYVASNGLATHPMMNDITATNLQVPLAVDFSGANAWKIPLAPAIAAATTTAVDGPIGVAVNGVPIFNPCKQGGCQNGDTKVLGELDSCNGHAGRGDDYHYHAAPTCMMAGQAASYWDTHPVGWALDGFAIFGYNNADGTLASRDGVCGGNTTTVTNGPAGYSYHVTDASPYVLSCFRGTPSTAARGVPLRQPPVTPFPVSAMTLKTDATDGYQVLQFTSARPFTTTETGTDSYANAAGTYNIRYKSVTGAALATLLATTSNAGKTACWNFQFTNTAGATTQPTISYCH